MIMFRIESRGFFHRKKRLVSQTKLAQSDFAKVARSLGKTPLRARKIGYVAARVAEQAETIQTHANGKETNNSASPGDWIATNLGPDHEVIRDKSGHENSYVIKAEIFPTLYDSIAGKNEFGDFFKAKNLVDAVYLSGGFDILAPWGQKETADVGYLLLSGHEVYGNNASTFDATYEIVR
jgi:hypothetical protein